MSKKELVKALKERNLDWSTGKQLDLMERLLEAAEVEYQDRLSKAAGKITEQESSMDEERYLSMICAAVNIDISSLTTTRLCSLARKLNLQNSMLLKSVSDYRRAPSL